MITLLLAMIGCGRAAPPETLPGVCDASAVIALDGTLLVTDDEATTIAVYRDGALVDRISLLEPLQRALGRDLERDDGAARELDLEAVERAGERLWWLGSHGLNREGKERPNRRMLFATNLPTLSPGEPSTLTVLGTPRDLRSALQAMPDLGPELLREATTAPKLGGLNVEGLAVDRSSGSLLLGLRSPVTAGKAWIVELREPDAFVADPDATPQLSVRARLDLGGRGIRSMTWSETLGSYVIVAGPMGTDSDFALYRWDGAAEVAPLPYAVGDLHPEGVTELDGALVLVSDDGTVRRGGTECKARQLADATDRQVYFRTMRIPLR